MEYLARRHWRQEIKMTIIILKNWHQLDFTLKNPLKDLLEIASIMKTLKKDKLISKWFFLFEGKTIRVRMKSKNSKQLLKMLTRLSLQAGLQMDSGLPFSNYQEGDEMLFNKDVVEAFANIMSETTQLVIKKLKNETDFVNYRVLERLQHCIFNNMLMFFTHINAEEYFLQQRLLERTRQPFDSDFDLKFQK